MYIRWISGITALYNLQGNLNMALVAVGVNVSANFNVDVVVELCVEGKCQREPNVDLLFPLRFLSYLTDSTVLPRTT